jgi:hypothetical protein
MFGMGFASYISASFTGERYGIHNSRQFSISLVFETLESYSDGVASSIKV